jgi:hypothetical protein
MLSLVVAHPWAHDDMDANLLGHFIECNRIAVISEVKLALFAFADIPGQVDRNCIETGGLTDIDMRKRS